MRKTNMLILKNGNIIKKSLETFRIHYIYDDNISNIVNWISG